MPLQIHKILSLFIFLYIRLLARQAIHHILTGLQDLPIISMGLGNLQKFNKFSKLREHSEW